MVMIPKNVNWVHFQYYENSGVRENTHCIGFLGGFLNEWKDKLNFFSTIY